MTLYLILSVVAFVLGVVIPELLRVKLDAATEPVSTYLTGPYHWIEDAGFGALAAAFVVLALTLDGVATVFALATAAGVIGAMATDSFGLGGPARHVWHIRSAALAFIAAFALELATAHGWLWYPVAAYPVAVGLVYLWHPEASAWQEKTAVALICIWLVCFAVAS